MESISLKSVIKFLAKLFLIIVILPIALLAIAESCLRIIGVGFPNELFIKEKIGNREVYRANFRAGFKFFPAQLARKPLPEIFDVKKASSTFRIFILGESAARGEQLADFSFGRILETVLNKALTNKKIEVINTGIPAINSWVINEFSKEIMNLEPDLLIFYGGHNEFVGPYGPASAFNRNSTRLSTKIGIMASNLKLVQWLKSLLSDRVSVKSWKGLEMFINNSIEPMDPVIKMCAENYKQNMSEIFKRAQKNKVPVISCLTPSKFLDWPPFISKKTEFDDSLIKTLLEKWEECSKSNDYSTLLKELENLNARNPYRADINYLYGLCLLKFNKVVEAKTNLFKARDNDCFKVRADSTLNAALKSASEDSEVVLLDLVSEFDKPNENSINSLSLFYDHVHLNEHGHYLVAKNIYSKIKETNLLPINSFDFPGEAQVLKDIGFTDFDQKLNLQYVAKSLESPPFTLQIWHQKDLGRRKISLNWYKQNTSLPDCMKDATDALNKNPSDYRISSRLGLMYQEAGLLDEALIYMNKSFELNPFNIDLINNRGILLYSSGRFDEAIKDFKHSLKVAPNFAKAWFNLGLVYTKKKDMANAEKCYRSAIEIESNYYSAYNNLGNLLVSQKKYNEAISVFENLVKLNPNMPQALNGLAACLGYVGKNSKAIELLQNALKNTPTNTEIKFNLARTHEKEGNLSMALKIYDEILEIDQNYLPAVKSLIRLILNNSSICENSPVRLIELAEKACKLTSFKDIYFLQVLSSAYAQEGKINEAISVTSTAIELAERTGNNQAAKDLKDNIQLLQSQFKH